MKIGELAKKTGLSIDAIRFYEREGLVRSPKRSENGYREFNAETAADIDFISRARALDIPLKEVKKLLSVRSGSTRTCREANEVIDQQLLLLRKRIQELKSLEVSLSELRSVCQVELSPKDCKIIRKLNRPQLPK